MTRAYRMQDIKIDTCDVCPFCQMYYSGNENPSLVCEIHEKDIPDNKTIPDFCQLETLEEYQWKEDLKIRIDSVLRYMEQAEKKIEADLVDLRSWQKLGGLEDNASLNGKLSVIRETIKLLKKAIEGDE